MKSIKLIAFLLCSVFSVYGCTNQNPTKKADTVQPADSPQKRSFSLPQMPENLTTSLERGNYLVEHYWDNFDFTDTAYISLPQITEQAIVNFVQVLPYAQQDVSEKAIRETLNKAAKTKPMYTYFIDQYKKYIYDPNSPVRNEVFYIPVLEFIISDSISDLAEKERAKFNLTMVKKNQPGETATDFTYTLLSGKTERMHNIKADFTLVMFYNPDCHACSELITKMKSSQILSQFGQNKSLAILSVYPDENIEIWKQHIGDIPKTWINGYNKGATLFSKQLYDLKAIPTLYLLDKDKKVILKDVDFPFLEQWIYEYMKPKVVVN